MIPACPVCEDLNRVQTCSADPAKTMRQLRRDLRLCRSCPSAEDCPILQNFNLRLQTAVSEVTAEWRLTPTFRQEL